MSILNHDWLDAEFTSEQLASHQRQSEIVLANVVQNLAEIAREHINSGSDFLMTELTEEELDAISVKVVDELLRGAEDAVEAEKS